MSSFNPDQTQEYSSSIDQTKQSKQLQQNSLSPYNPSRSISSKRPMRHCEENKIKSTMQSSVLSTIMKQLDPSVSVSLQDIKNQRRVNSQLALVKKSTVLNQKKNKDSRSSKLLVNRVERLLSTNDKLETQVGRCFAMENRRKSMEIGGNGLDEADSAEIMRMNR
jgi:hypothetical protein